ncbi:MAG: O-antigen ligase family protein [Oscillospiraceae bacterium]|nr:O-antigen ligase family protein [Oscillospiraceae bacterium]
MGQNKQKQNFKDYKKQRDRINQMREKRAQMAVSIIAVAFFLALTALYPLYIWKSKYLNLTYEKTFFYWMLTLVLAVPLVCAAIVKKSCHVKVPEQADPKKKFTVAKWSLVAFLSFCLLSALTVSRLPWGESVKSSVWLGYSGRFEGVISFFCYGAAFFLIAWFYRPRRWHMLIVAASAIMLSLCGILQFGGHDVFELFPFEDFPAYGALSAYFRTTLGNINIVSAYCTFSVVLFAALFAVSDTFFRFDALYLVASALSFALMLIARGDASYVAVAASMVLCLPYWLSDKKRLGKILIALSGWCAAYGAFCAYVADKKSQYEIAPEDFARGDRSFLNGFEPVNLRFWFFLALFLFAAGLLLVLLRFGWPGRIMKISGIFALPAALIAGFLFVEFGGPKWADTPNNIIWQMREILHGRFDDNFGSKRGWVWKRAFSVLFDRPIFGAGPDSFYYALGEQLQGESWIDNGVIFDKAHNIFLQIAVCMGLPALMSYLAFLGSLFASALKKAFMRPYLLAFGATAASYFIQSFFCVEVPLTTPLFWVCLGVMAGEISRGDEKDI